MSVKEMVGFFEKLESDQELQATVKELEKLDVDQASEQMVEIGAAAGYSFTTSDLEIAREARARGELSIEELEAVAGGRGEMAVLQPSRGGMYEAEMIDPGMLERVQEPPHEACKPCCHWAQGCMPGFPVVQAE